MPFPVITFHHGDRVKNNDRPGVILRCRRKDGSGYYFKVKLDSGEWEWPRRIEAETPGGRHELRCEECRIPFRSNDRNDQFCPACETRLHTLPQDPRDDGIRWGHNMPPPAELPPASPPSPPLDPSMFGDDDDCPF